MPARMSRTVNAVNQCFLLETFSDGTGDWDSIGITKGFVDVIVDVDPTNDGRFHVHSLDHRAIIHVAFFFGKVARSIGETLLA